MLSRGEDIVPVVGARRRDQLAEALGATALQLTTEDLEATSAPCLPARRRVIATMRPRWRRSTASAAGDVAVSETVLTFERILEAAEDVLRRQPAKATVVDVARALEVSHGSVYRHFPSKAALRDGRAVAREDLGATRGCRERGWLGDRAAPSLA